VPDDLLPTPSLTPRQLETVRAYVAHGSVAGAAEALGMSTHTAHTHLAAARERAGAGSTVELVYRVAVSEARAERER
jgi:DNA-binding CsgD family transcriptional regulator